MILPVDVTIPRPGPTRSVCSLSFFTFVSCGADHVAPLSVDFTI